MSDSRITVIKRKNNLTETLSNYSNETIQSVSLETSTSTSSSCDSNNNDDDDDENSVTLSDEDLSYDENKRDENSKHKLSLNEILKKSKPKKDKKQKIDDEKLYTMAITVKESSVLKFNRKIHKPRVRMSLFNNAGQILMKKKQNKSKKETNSNENSISFNYLTDPGEINNSNSFSFCWHNNSTGEFNDEIDFLKLHNFIIFFELIDNSNTKSLDEWYRIAWSFLRPAESNNDLTKYKNNKITLQLFKYQQKSSKFDSIFGEYTKRKRQKYPAILKIVINCKEFSNETIQIPLRQASAAENESIGDGVVNVENNIFGFADLNWQKVINKLKTRTFKMPEENIYKKCNAEKGSSVSCFSLDSSLLAFTELYRNFSVIVIFDILKFERKLALNGHEGNIHCLEWMKGLNDDGGKLLVSSSEDQTCIVWKILEKSYCILHVLYHPTFVYCATFFENNLKGFNGIVTGCRDGTLRIWTPNRTKNHLNLWQEINQHESYIICLAFNERSNRLYSGDYSGVIIEWKMDKKNWILRRKLTNNKKILKDFHLSALLHRLYILTLTDLTIIELSSGFQSSLLNEIPLTDYANKLSISQCGTFIFIAFQLKIICWCCKTKIILKQIEFRNLISSIDFNYENNILSISTFGYGGGIFMYSPLNFFNIQNITRRNQESKKHNNFSMSMNSHFNSVLKKLDSIFNLDDADADAHDDDDGILKIIKGHQRVDANEPLSLNDQTFSVALNRTFSISQISAENVGEKTFSISERKLSGKNTFTVGKKNDIDDQSANDTDISQSLA